MNNVKMYEEQFDNNMNDDDMNDYDYDKNNQYQQYDEYNPENNRENVNNNNNHIFINNNKENKELKNKIIALNKLLIQKNNELKEIRIKNDNQLRKINKTFDTHINEYQKLVQNYSNLQKDFNEAQNEIQNKNQIIIQLQNNHNFNKNKEDGNIIILLNQKINNIYQNFFEKGNNIFDENIFVNTNNDNRFKLLTRNLDIFSRELINYKNNKINEIIKLKNIIQNNNNYNIDPQFYLKFIDLINNFYSSLSNNINDFNKLPNYSLKDKNEKKYKDILITIKILTDYIISNKNNDNNLILNNIDNKYNQELNKRLTEMSTLLMKSNDYLNKSRQENNELKQKYYDLEKRYNLTVKDISTIDNNNKSKDINVDKFLNELNKKNQQIKSLEHMVARLTHKINNTNTNNFYNNPNNKSTLTDTSYYGRIINKKIYNEIKSQNQSKCSYYISNNKFVKDEKNETNLRIFLDKYTNGEYGNTSKMNDSNNINNKLTINLKDEIENLNRGISNEFSYDEIDNEQNYNEEEEERKYQMEGKINN